MDPIRTELIEAIAVAIDSLLDLDIALNDARAADPPDPELVEACERELARGAAYLKDLKDALAKLNMEDE